MSHSPQSDQAMTMFLGLLRAAVHADELPIQSRLQKLKGHYSLETYICPKFSPYE